MDFSTQSQDRSFYNAIENGFKALNNSLDWMRGALAFEVWNIFKKTDISTFLVDG